MGELLGMPAMFGPPIISGLGDMNGGGRKAIDGGGIPKGGIGGRGGRNGGGCAKFEPRDVGGSVCLCERVKDRIRKVKIN